MKRFPEKLAILRKKRNLSQRELGKILEIDYRHIGRMEQGTTLPGAAIVLKIANFFNITPNELMLDDLDLTDI
jgi:transcriptional regulator with XRE-family HTH domain